MIPRKIHYCWFGPKPLPAVVLKCLKTWKEHLPHYDLVLWNEKNSPMQVPYVQEAYSAKKYAFVSDYVRFWALYNHGGFYLDTDMFVVKSFNELLNYEVVFGWETNQKINLSCGVIGAVPKQSFIGEIKDHYENLHFNLSNIPDLVVPGIVSHCYRKYSSKEYITILPYDYFYPFPYEEKENTASFMEYRTERTFAIHLWDVSWGTYKDKLRDRIFYHIRQLWRKAK
jgi:mannosyltransferase OCH1-like enzyme